MNPIEKTKVPLAQRSYGEIVYWVTILAALICMVGPVVAMASPGKNILDPSRLFGNIFAGEKPLSVWALSSTEEVKLMVSVGSEHEGWSRPATELGPREAAELLAELPPPGDGEATGAVLEIEGRLRLGRGAGETYLDLRPEPPDELDAAEARDRLLAVYGGEVFHDGHFWAEHLGAGDGLTQFGLALGCSVALWALIVAAGAYLRDKVMLYVILALWVAALVFLTAANLVQAH
jgi:hypothetical protein